MSALEDLPPSRISPVEVPLRGRKDHRTSTIESLYDSVSDSCSCTYLVCDHHTHRQLVPTIHHHGGLGAQYAVLRVRSAQPVP